MSYFDFYSEGKEEFYNKYEGTSTCVYRGDCAHNIPLVSVIVPTYKRPELLKQAIDSVLGQKDFDDYELIVMDNDAAHINEDTDTFVLMNSYKSNKISYYRNNVVLTHNQDYGVSIARGKWIVFLHDDDLLNPYHLKILTEIASKNSAAKYISCPMKEFIYDDGIKQIINATKYKYSIYTRPKVMVCFGYYPGWLGALIDRVAYINSGGMPTYCNNLGDYCMVQKFHYKYGIWDMEGDAPLYFHGIWEKQASANGSKTWNNLFVSEYEYYQYVSKVFHPITYTFWERISSYKILDDAKMINRGIYQYNIDLMNLATSAGMSTNFLYKNLQYKIDMILCSGIEAIYNKSFVRKCDEGEVLL